MWLSRKILEICLDESLAESEGMVQVDKLSRCQMANIILYREAGNGGLAENGQDGPSQAQRPLALSDFSCITIEARRKKFINQSGG